MNERKLGGEFMKIASVAVAWLALAALAFALFLTNPLASVAIQYNRDIAVAGTGFYATLRSVNAVMSVLKDADVQASIGVASVSGSPGQVLQPVTETIGRMADLLFGMTIVSGVLSFLLAPIAKVSALVLGAVSMLRAGIITTGRQPAAAAAAVIRTVLFVGLFGALVLPGSYALAFVAGNQITQEAWNNATRAFNEIGARYDEAAVVEEIGATGGASAAASSVPYTPEQTNENESGGSLISRGMDVFGSAVDASRAAIGETVASASNLVSSVGTDLASKTQAIRDGLEISGVLFTASIEIAVAYIVKLIVLPVLIVGVALLVLRSAFRSS